MKELKDSRDYVLNHQYGYGLNKEKRNLNKLNLRSIEDLRVYVNDVVGSSFNASYINNILRFDLDNSEFELVIEETL